MQAALCSTGLAMRGILAVEDEAMRLIVYGAVAAIALGSVLLGLDWLSAPMPPMVNTEAGLRVVAPPRAAVPAAAPVATVSTPAPAVAAPKATIAAPIVSPNLAAPRSVELPASPDSTAQAVPAEPIAAPQPTVRCNVNACATAYPHSFRATDCTYQPSNGPRRLCAKETLVPQPAAAPVATVSTPAPAVAAPKATIAAPIVSPNLAAPRSVELPASPDSTAQAVPAEPIAAPQPTVRCNVNACATAYPHSFRATDCTYQPSNGPRRLCAKETLVPQPAAAPVATVSTPAPAVAAPKATIAAPIVSPNLAAPRSVELPASPDSTAQAVPAEPIAAPQPTVRCNVNACATAYPHSFRATDCTYQPSNGPRRLCAKETLVPQPAAAPVATVSTPAPAVAAPKATIAAPIVSPNLAAPRSVELPASPDSTAQAVPAEPIAAPQPTVRCNVNACATAYPHSFRATDCTYQPSNGPRRLCAKETLVPQPAAAPGITTRR